MSDDRFEQALAACATALQDLKVPHAIIGGVAVIAHGVGRGTIDVDATLDGAFINARALLEGMSRQGFKPRRSDAVAFAAESNVLLLIHGSTGVPIDLTFAWIPFEAELIQNAVERRFGSTKIRVPTPTDLVVMKLVAHRPKDIGDCEQLVRLHPIDFERVRSIVTEFAALLEDTTRLDTLRRLEAMPDRR